MRKPALIRAIYAELRQMLGDEVAAVDLLKIAHHFVRTYSDPLDETKEWGVAQDGRPFATLPVDEAMSDGGWRVLMFERSRVASWPDRRDPLEMARLVPILNHYLPGWRQVNWDGYGLIEPQ